MAYATVEDVESRFTREVSDEEGTLVQSRLEEVKAIIRTRIPDLDEKIASGTLSKQVIIIVESEAVLRVLRNPEGFSQKTDGNYSYSMSSTNAPGRILILPEEWVWLGLRRGIFTIRPYLKKIGRAHV